MPERAFLEAVTASLRAAALAPAPTSVGPAEPNVPGDLPALVLGLLETGRVGAGLGGVTRTRDDLALQVTSTISLASPFLPNEPGFSLWTPATRTLTLPHGGLVRRDLGVGPLGAADIQVRINGGAPLPLAAGVPAAGQYAVTPDVGQLRFGSLPPANATIQATYHLGLWTQQIQRIRGVLGIDVVAANVGQVTSLTVGVIDHLMAPQRKADIVRLLAINVVKLGTIGRPETGTNGRRRSVALSFDFEEEINLAPSSGGLILRVPVDTYTVTARVASDGGIVEDTVLEQSG